MVVRGSLRSLPELGAADVLFCRSANCVGDSTGVAFASGFTRVPCAGIKATGSRLNDGHRLPAQA